MTEEERERAIHAVKLWSLYDEWSDDQWRALILAWHGGTNHHQVLTIGHRCGTDEKTYRYSRIARWRLSYFERLPADYQRVRRVKVDK